MAEVSYGEGEIEEDVKWIKNTLIKYPDDSEVHKSVREFIRTHHTGNDRIQFLNALFGDAEIRMALRRGAKYLDHVSSPSK